MTIYDRPFGRYLEDFVPGDVYRHWPGKTITEADDHLFCMITMNHHPLHTNAWFAEHETVQGKNVVVGNLVYSLALGMSVPDVSGSCIANLEVESLLHRSPTFHGDTIYAETRVLEATPSKSKDDRGIVAVETKAFNQRGEEVCYFRRKLMVWKKAHAPDAPPSLRRRRLGLSRSRPHGSGGSSAGCSSGVPHIDVICHGGPRVIRGAILVSEVMLQQTQVDRVIGYYESFLAAFPTPGHCARARSGRRRAPLVGTGLQPPRTQPAPGGRDGRGRARRSAPRGRASPARAAPAWVPTRPVPSSPSPSSSMWPPSTPMWLAFWRGCVAGTGLTVDRGAEVGRPPVAGRTLLGIQPSHVRPRRHGLHRDPAGVRRVSPPSPVPLEASRA